MLFVVSLLFVTLMQIVVIHSDRKILLSYNWRNGVSSISSSLITNVTTSSSILKQMLRGLNYSTEPGGGGGRGPGAGSSSRDHKGDITRSGTGNTSVTAASSSSPTTTTTTTTTVKKKPDVLRIEALLDRSLPSRDVNVKVLQNFVNSARIKEIIQLLQDRGALDSSPDATRQNVTMIWNQRLHNQSREQSHNVRKPDSPEGRLRREELSSSSSEILEGSKEGHAFESGGKVASVAGGMPRRRPAAHDRDHGIHSYSHQEGSSRRSPAAMASAWQEETGTRNLDHEIAHHDGERERQLASREDGEESRSRERGNQGKESQRQRSSSSSSSSSSSPSSTASTPSSSSSQSNQEIDFPAQHRRSGNLPEAFVIVNSTGRRGGISDSVSNPSSAPSSPLPYHANAATSPAASHQAEQKIEKVEDLIRFPDSDDGKDANQSDEGDQRFNEVNFTKDNLPRAPWMTSNSTSLIAWSQGMSQRRGSLFQQLMMDPENRTTCAAIPPNLIGRILINMEPVIGENMSAIAHSNPNVSPGGHFAPSSCFPRHRVAIVIPYRDRWEHLSILLYHLHPILQRQQLEYKIYVAEQFGNETFNKGVLMNAGVREALKEADYHCFIFHDVDLIPEDDRNLYSCPISPRHMSYAVDKFNYT